LRFSGCFHFSATTDIHDIQIHYHSLTLSLVLASDSPTVSAPFS